MIYDARCPGQTTESPSTARSASALHVLLLALLVGVLGCGGDDNPADSGAGSDGSELAGSWTATSFTADGNDGIDLGMLVTMTFAVSSSSSALRAVSGTWTVDIANDVMDLCDSGPDCISSGAFEVVDGSLVFDPGTQDELTWAYSVTGTTLSMSASIDGTAVVITATLS
jgi:hypothetical protein